MYSYPSWYVFTCLWSHELEGHASQTTVFVLFGTAFRNCAESIRSHFKTARKCSTTVLMRSLLHRLVTWSILHGHIYVLCVSDQNPNLPFIRYHIFLISELQIHLSFVPKASERGIVFHRTLSNVVLLPIEQRVREIHFIYLLSVFEEPTSCLERRSIRAQFLENSH